MELTPLLDVVFLLLTFFALTLVLLVRAEVMGVSLPALGDAEPLRDTGTVTVALDAEGAIHIDGRETDLEALPARVLEALEQDPPPRLLLAIDQEGRSGRLIEVVGALRAAGITDFGIIGEVAPEPAEPAGVGPF